MAALRCMAVSAPEAAADDTCVERAAKFFASEPFPEFVLPPRESIVSVEATCTRSFEQLSDVLSHEKDYLRKARAELPPVTFLV